MNKEYESLERFARQSVGDDMLTQMALVCIESVYKDGKIDLVEKSQLLDILTINY
jgi:hypothetical protein